MRLRPGGDRARHRVHTMVQVDPGVRVVGSEDKPETAATVGARVVLLPPFEGHRKGGGALIERAPGGRVGCVRVAEGLRVNGDFGQFHLAGLLVDTVGTTPQHPLWPCL